MAFNLGNHSIDEVLFGVAEDQDGELLYTLDQLSTASIEISAESTDITDKKGNLVRTLYTSKSGTFTATNAFLHPQLMNAASGSEITTASGTSKIQMPTYAEADPGAEIDVTGFVTGTVKVSGRSGNGADVKIYTAADSEALITGTKMTLPTDTDVTSYFVEYEKEYSEGIKLVNEATKFPDVVELKLFCSYVDPCDDKLKSCVVRIPRFMADPNVTISLDRENQQMDFNGTISMDYCSGTEKVLYEIYYPGQA